MGVFIPFSILFLVCGLISLLLSDSKTDLQNLPITMGQIIQVHQSEAGNTYYYIGFDINGQYYEGYSVYYFDTLGKYRIGDPVSVGYFFTKKGKAILVLNDPDMLHTSSKPSISHRVFFTLSGICLALFIITLILF